MPTKKPRFLITLESEEQHVLLKEFAKLQGRSVSAVINDLLETALRPVVAMKRLAAHPSAQADLVDFLQGLFQVPGALPDPHGEGAAGDVPGPSSEGVAGGREAREHAAQRQRSGRPATPGRRPSAPSNQPSPPPYGNTGVSLPQPIDNIRTDRS